MKLYIYLFSYLKNGIRSKKYLLICFIDYSFLMLQKLKATKSDYKIYTFMNFVLKWLHNILVFFVKKKIAF